MRREKKKKILFQSRYNEKKKITFITQLMDAENENEPIFIPKASIIIWIMFHLDR